MPISLSQLKAVVRPLTIELEGDLLTIWYKPYEMTPELLDMAQRRDADGTTTPAPPQDAEETKAARASVVEGLISAFVKSKDKEPEALAALAEAVIQAATVRAAGSVASSGNAAMVLALIEKWDLSEEPGGPPLPITAEALPGVAFKVTSLILDAIIEDQRPNPQKVEGSFGSSS